MGQFNQPSLPQGVGTGIVLDLEGHILTNNHVIASAERIIVTLSTDASYTAEVVGVDDRTDTAVIRIEAEGLQPAMLGVSAELEVGEDVIAIGHALGLRGGPTVSKGVVSALGRSLDSDGQTTIVDLIQTDASINPGNSGGPLVNSRAQVVGINTAIIVESRGIGFAINIDDAKLVAAQLIEQGFVDRGFLGITPFNLTPAVISQLDLSLPEGVVDGILVRRVVTGFPAAEEGLQEGDVIVQLGDEPIANTGEMSKFLLLHPPGEAITVSYFRGPDRITVELTLGENPLK
jgi:S1-C subfamily serine protease